MEPSTLFLAFSHILRNSAAQERRTIRHVYLFGFIASHAVKFVEEDDWELLPADVAANSRTYGQLFIKVFQAVVNVPESASNLGALKVEVALTKTQGVAGHGTTGLIYNTNEPKWNHDFLFGIVSAEAPVNLTIVSSAFKVPISKFTIPLSTLTDGVVDDTWHPNDDGMFSSKIRLIMCFSPFVPHELVRMPPMLDMKSIGVKVPALFDSPASRLLNLDLPAFQDDRDFLYPEETVSGIVSLSARGLVLQMRSTPEIYISGLEICNIMIQDQRNYSISPNEKKPLLNEKRSCPSHGSSYCFVPPSLMRHGKESIVYKVRASVVLEPAGPANTIEVEAPFTIGGPLPPLLQRDKPRTHSFWFEKNPEHGVKFISAANPTPTTFASIHFTVPPGDTFNIGQENSISIRIDAGEPAPAPAPEQPQAPSPPVEGSTPTDLVESILDESVSTPLLSTSPPASPRASGNLRVSGSEKPKPIPEISVVRYRIVGRGHMIRRTVNRFGYPLIAPIRSGPAKVLYENETVLQFDENNEFEAMNGDIQSVSVPLRGGNREFVTLLTPKESLFPTLTTDVCSMHTCSYMLHLEIRFGTHKHQALIPINLSVPPPLLNRPASAYPEGKRILDITPQPNIVSIPIAYPEADGVSWKCLSGTTWKLESADLPK